MADPADNVVSFGWQDSFVNLMAGLGVPGRDKFASQAYTHVPMSVLELESAYRSDWIARKVVQIPAWDMTREWREWQADPDQITLLEDTEKKLLLQSKMQQALIKSRLYGGAVIIIGVDAGAPEEELDPELVTQDALKFLHVISKNNITAGPLIYDISSKYYGQPEYYEARNQPASKNFQQAELPNPQFSAQNVRLHPSRVVKLIGMETADQMISNLWGDSVLQPVNDAIKMCGLVTGSLATLMSELKVDVIKIPELKSILSTQAGERKMIARFQAANVAKSVVNTIMIDGNEEWQRIQSSFAGIPEVIQTYMQMAAGAADIPATRFLGMSPRGLNATGESDIRNYYDRLAAEQTTILTPTMDVLDEVLIRSALGDRPPEVWYEWKSLWQLNVGEKADIAMKKAQAYQIDVNAAQLPPVALANARANQLIEDGVYPGLEKALEQAALEGDTIESENAAPVMDPAMEAMKTMAQTGMMQPPGQPGGPPMPPQPPMGGNVMPFMPKKPNPFAKKKNPFAKKDSAVGDHNPNHDPEGKFSSGGGSSGGTATAKTGKTGLKQRASDFANSNTAKKAIDAVAKAAGLVKKHHKDIIAQTVSTGLGQVIGGNTPHEVEQAIHNEIKNLSDNLGVAKQKTARVLKNAVKRLITRRRVRKDAMPPDQPDDDVLAALEELLKVLDKIISGYGNGSAGDGVRPFDVDDFNKCHNEHGEEGGEFCGEGGAGGGSSGGGKETGVKGDPKSAKAHGEKAAKENKTAGVLARVAGALRRGEASASKGFGAAVGRAKQAVGALKAKSGGEVARVKTSVQKGEAKAEVQPGRKEKKPKGEKPKEPDKSGQKTVREKAKGEKKSAAEELKAAREKLRGAKKATAGEKKTAKQASGKKGKAAAGKSAKGGGKSGGKGAGGKSAGGKGGGKGAGKGKAETGKGMKAKGAQGGNQAKQAKPQKQPPQKSQSGGGGGGSSSKSSGGGGGKSGGGSKSKAPGSAGKGTKGPAQPKPQQRQQAKQQQKSAERKQAIQAKLTKPKPPTISRTEWEAEKERLRKELLGLDHNVVERLQSQSQVNRGWWWSVHDRR